MRNLTFSIIEFGHGPTYAHKSSISPPDGIMIIIGGAQIIIIIISGLQIMIYIALADCYMGTSPARTATEVRNDIVQRKSDC